MTHFIKAIERDASIINALHIARYQLVIHDGLKCRCEGSEFKMDFTDALSEIDAVMTMLGVDLTEPLPAPPSQEGDDDD